MLVYRVFFLSLFLFCQPASANILNFPLFSPPVASDLTISTTEVFDTINLIVKFGSGILLAMGITGLYLVGRSSSELRRELREDVSRLRDFIESNREGERNLRSEIGEELSIGFQKLLESSIEDQVGTSFPRLMESVNQSKSAVLELEEKLSSLPQFDPTSLSVGIDYMAVLFEAENIRSTRVDALFAQFQSRNAQALPFLIDNQLREQYISANIRDPEQRKRVRQLFVRALKVAEKHLSFDDPAFRDLESLDANTFYNLAAECGNWRMIDVNQRFAQIAYSLNQAPLYGLKAIETSLASGERKEGGFSEIGIGAKRTSVNPLEKMLSLLKADRSQSRYISISVAWNICLHLGTFTELLGYLEKEMMTETEDQGSWVEISYANFTCARIHAALSKPDWKAKYEFHVARTRRKLELESAATGWWLHSSDDLKSLSEKVSAQGEPRKE